MATLYHANSVNSNPKHHQPIPGGTFSIQPLSLLITWAAYRLKLIDWLSFRVWLTLHQIQCWQLPRQPHSQPSYTRQQIRQALHSPSLPLYKINHALKQLQSLNIASFSPSAISFTHHLHQIDNPHLHQLAADMLDRLGHANASRTLRMPRRMLVHLMTTPRPRPIYAGVMLGLLLRCMMYKRYDTYKGSCTSAWLTAVFGGNTSCIKSARSQLIAEGWFRRLPTLQRVRQKHGEWIALALETPPPDTSQIQPPQPQKTAQTQPPLQNQSLSPEMQSNQSLQLGASPNSSKPSWNRIQLIDLSTPHRRQLLYQAAVDAKATRPTNAAELAFFAAIAHTRRVATRNPCGLLRHLVETPQSQTFISQQDEDQATSWLNSRTSPANTPTPSLSTDAQFIRILRRNLAAAGYHDDPYTYLTSTPQGLSEWPPERWLRATVELLADAAR